MPTIIEDMDPKQNVFWIDMPGHTSNDELIDLINLFVAREILKLAK